MQTIETSATVTPDGHLTVSVRSGLRPGDHRVVLVVDEDLIPTEDAAPWSLLDLPPIQVDAWPHDLSLRREDMYDDFGR